MCGRYVLKASMSQLKETSDGKQPYYIYLKDQDLMSFAGLYENWERYGQIRYHPVSKEVNSPKNQGEELIDPV